MITLFFLLSSIQAQFLHAPELIRGQALCVTAPLHLCYIDGGDWQAVQIGKRKEDIEVGFFLHVGGADIDNDNQPVGYRVEWRNDHKYIGEILYREHGRKLCAANYESNLPCR